MRILHVFFALLLTFIWGTNFVFIKYGLRELPPFLFACLRFLFVALPLVFILPRPPVAWRYLLGYGVLIGFGQFGLLFWAMQDDISPGLASLVIQIQAFFTILLAALLFKESINRWQLFALAICFSGLLLIIMNTGGQTTLLGLFIVLIAASSWAGGNLIVKKVGKVNIIAFIAWSSLFSILPLFFMSWYFEGFSLIQLSLQQASFQAWSVVLWQSVGNTLIGYGLWNMLLNHYSAISIAPWALLVPVFGMSASFFALNEPMPWWKIVAAFFILSGLMLNLQVTRYQKQAILKAKKVTE